MPSCEDSLMNSLLMKTECVSNAVMRFQIQAYELFIFRIFKLGHYRSFRLPLDDGPLFCQATRARGNEMICLWPFDDGAEWSPAGAHKVRWRI